MPSFWSSLQCSHEHGTPMSLSSLTQRYTYSSALWYTTQSSVPAGMSCLRPYAHNVPDLLKAAIRLARIIEQRERREQSIPSRYRRSGSQMKERQNENGSAHKSNTTPRSRLPPPGAISNMLKADTQSVAIALIGSGSTPR